MFVKIVIYAAGMSYCELFSIIVRILIDLLYRYELLNRRQKMGIFDEVGDSTSFWIYSYYLDNSYRGHAI